MWFQIPFGGWGGGIYNILNLKKKDTTYLKILFKKKIEK